MKLIAEYEDHRIEREPVLIRVYKEEWGCLIYFVRCANTGEWWHFMGVNDEDLIVEHVAHEFSYLFQENHAKPCVHEFVEQHGDTLEKVVILQKVMEKSRDRLHDAKMTNKKELAKVTKQFKSGPFSLEELRQHNEALNNEQ